MKYIIMRRKILFALMVLCMIIQSPSSTRAQVIRNEYHVKGKTIIEKKRSRSDGKTLYSYSVKELLDSIETVKKTRKSVYTKDHLIVWRNLSVKEKEIPRLGSLFYEYADSLFELGPSNEYLSNFYFFIYDTGGIIVQSFTSDKDLIGTYGYAEEIIELLEKLQTFRFSTPVLAHFDKDYYIDSVGWSKPVRCDSE